MRKIIFSLSIILGVAAMVAGATRSFFSDTETSQNNTIQTGTVDIDVDGQNPWTGKYNFANMQPGDTKEISFNIKNVGTNPVRVWQILENVQGLENGISEPEQQWYDENHITSGKNDVDSAMDFGMDVDGNLVLEKEAGVTVGDIKDYYLNLVKTDVSTDPGYTGQATNGTGILNPGGTISVKHVYYFNPNKAGNWAQSDKLTFDIRILSQQVDSPEPVHLLSFMQNKNSSWNVVGDSTVGVLKYDSIGKKFGYNFTGIGLNAIPSGQHYDLIYYADPNPGNNPGFLIDSGVLGSDGKLVLSGSKDLGMDLPHENDSNKLGAKIWLIPSGQYNESTHSVLSWSPITSWLFDNWPGFINYTRGDKPVESIADDPDEGSSTPSDPPASNHTIALSELGGDVANQYGYNINYNDANVNFAYNTPASGKLTGTITATGLKPYATYQIKFIGKPTCAGSGGNDTANEYIGYKGRWTVTNVACSGAGCNRTDTQYEANKATHTECIAGYLLWDFFTADASGKATKVVQTANSYHVLWSGGGTCGTSVNNYLAHLDSAHPAVFFSPADKVDGEIERGSCGGLTLNSGTYDLKMVLTEESFHQSPGTWATVLQKDINFTIN